MNEDEGTALMGGALHRAIFLETKPRFEWFAPLLVYLYNDIHAGVGAPLHVVARMPPIPLFHRLNSSVAMDPLKKATMLHVDKEERVAVGEHARLDGPDKKVRY